MSDWEQLELFDIRPYINSDLESWEGLPEGWNWADAVKEIDAILSEPVTPGTRELIAFYGVMLTSLLLHKNRRYGNSATEPLEVFAKGINVRQRLAVRMDDKLNRIARGEGMNSDDKEDPRPDLAGYILLDVIAEHLEKRRGA